MDQGENVLTVHCGSNPSKNVGKRGLPLSLPTIGSYAAEIYGAPLGVTWPTRFKKRHPELKVKVRVVACFVRQHETNLIKWTSALEECRARALNRPAVHDYFELLGDTIKQYDIKPKNIWNMDEKVSFFDGGLIYSNFFLVTREFSSVSATGSGPLLTGIRRLCRKSRAATEIWSPSLNASRLPGSPSIPLLCSKENVVICVGGRTILVMRGQFLIFGSCFPLFQMAHCMLSSISISPNGWTDQELGALWLEKDFAPASAKFLDDPGDYRLLILDGHNSHCTYRFISFAQVDA